MARARRLAWWSLAYLVSATVVVALVLGQSQAMKTAWFDDVLNFIPVIVFLVGSRLSLKPPNRRFPSGYPRVTSAAYPAAAAALFPTGAYLPGASAPKLLAPSHPTPARADLSAWS